MGSPAIFKGNRTKLLSSKGLLLADGTVIDNDGQKNYITAKDGSSIGSWVTYADAAGTSPVDGTGGSPTVTYAVSTDSSLRGTTNFLFTHGASNQQGQGFSYNFTIDPSDKTKVLQISLEYLIASGTYADDDLQFWIYDVTNAALIQPAPFKLKNSGIIEKFAMEFQATTSTSYRLIGHVATSTATAYTIRFGNWSLGPQAKLYGSPITDWVTFTPTGSWTTNSVYTGRWRRVGSNMELEYRVSLGGAPNSTFLYFLLPTGYTIDGNSILATAQGAINGSGIAVDNGVQYYDLVAQYYSSTAIGVWKKGASATDVTVNNYVTETSPFTWGSEDYLTFTASVPIAGWSSSQVMSSDANTRVIALRARGTGGSPNADTPVILTTVDNDTHNAYSISTGKFTAPVSGYYRVSAFINPSTLAAGSFIYVSVNGSTSVPSSSTPILGVNSVVNYPISGSATVYALAGQSIDIRPSANTTTIVSNSSLSIEYISGPSQIAASESIGASYWLSANFTSNSTTPINFDSKEYDSHNAVTTSATAWRFTAPVSGRYLVNTHAAQVSTNTFYHLYKGGTSYKQLSYSTSGTMPTVNASVEIRLLAGEYIDMRAETSTSVIGGALNAAGAHNSHISISKIGNY